MATSNVSNRDDELTIDIQDVLHVLWANIVKIIAAMLAGGILLGAYSMVLVAPKYSAQARMYVLSGTESNLLKLSELEMSTQLTKDYVEMILSRPMLEEVIDELSLGDKFTVNSLASCISINNAEDTRILDINVTCTDAKLAADIANAVADVSARNISDIMETSAPKIFQRAIVNKSKVAPSHSKNILIGMLLGAVASVGIIFLLYITDDTIKSETDIEHYVGLPTFGVISDSPSGKKKKKKSSGYGYSSY